MRRSSSLLLAAAVVCAFSCSARAQKFLPKSIKFVGDPEYTHQELLDAAGLKEGVAMTTDEMNDHARRLMQWGVFDDLAYKFDGTNLVYSLTPASLLYPVHLSNLPLPPGRDVTETLHEKLPLYRGSVPSSGGLLDGVLSELQSMLAEEGIYANVTATPAGSRPGTGVAASMSFSIASPPVRVGNIEFQGVSPALLSQAQKLAAAASMQLFDFESSGRKLQQLFTGFYEDRGYATAKVRVLRTGNPVTTPNSILVPFSISVEEGNAYRFQGIELPPEAEVSQKEIRQALQSQNVKGVLPLEAVWALILGRCQSTGHMNCMVHHDPQIDKAAGTFTYRVEVVPGPVYHFGFVKFTNVSEHLRRLLMRNWTMLPGDPFDITYLDRFMTSAEQNDPELKRAFSGEIARFETDTDQQTHEVNVVASFPSQMGADR